MKIRTKMAGLLITLFIVMPSGPANAEAFCALRDPQKSIYDLFPEATNYRSIVRVIDESTKQEVEARLPPQTLHFSELGRHTLYVALAGDKALGFIHVRSEASRWGLVEIAWALDLELRIIDFRFQRCRSTKKRLLQTENFRNQIRGKRFAELLALLKPGTDEIDTDKLSVPIGAEELAQVLVRCGLKTTLVTELAWQKDIRDITLLHQANSIFGEVGEISVIDNPFSAAIEEKLNAAFGGASLGTKQESVVVAKVFNPEKKFLGSLYRNTAEMGGQAAKLWWAIDKNNVVKQIHSSNGWRDMRDKSAFQALLGRNFASADECNNRAEMMALEAIITADH